MAEARVITFRRLHFLGSLVVCFLLGLAIGGFAKFTRPEATRQPFSPVALHVPGKPLLSFARPADDREPDQDRRANTEETVPVRKDLLKWTSIHAFNSDLVLSEAMIALLSLQPQQIRDLQDLLTAAKRESEAADEANLVILSEDQTGTVFMLPESPSPEAAARKAAFQNGVSRILAPWQAEVFRARSENRLHNALGDFGNETRVYRLRALTPDSGQKGRYGLDRRTIENPDSLRDVPAQEIFTSEKLHWTTIAGENFVELPRRYQHLISLGTN